MMNPWDVNPDLQQERLIQLANMLAEVRADVVDLHNPELGDTRKSLGFRAYECSRSHCIDKAGQLGFEWLGVLTEDRRFTLKVGSIPVRFWKGEPEKLPSGKLLRSPEALNQIELFHPKNSDNELIWFCILDANFKGLIERAYFVGYTEIGEIVINWQIPIRGSITLISDVNHMPSDGIELDSAANRLRAKIFKDDAIKNE
ncbi:hypothetical protein [Thiothrix lacustris]|uniref:hypothetical protein n=1 Tax=Thiothrix lacustris TaxID=525917 RepID=UPI0004903402|nr:hypothetical protein [Thiothrix lacustris]